MYCKVKIYNQFLSLNINQIENISSLILLHINFTVMHVLDSTILLQLSVRSSFNMIIVKLRSLNMT